MLRQTYRRLAHAWSEPVGRLPALAAYTAARRAHLNYYQWASSLLTPVFQSDTRLLPVLRDMFMPLACRMPGVRGQMLSTLIGSKTGWLWGKLKLG